MNYIGIDLGTTAVKCCLYRNGREEFVFSSEYGLISNGCFVEQDADTWWNLICKGIRSLVEQSNEHTIHGISVSTQGITVLPVDKNGQPMALALSWLDCRAEEEVVELRERYGSKRIFEITGKNLLSCYTLPKLLWLRKHQPDWLNSATKLLFPLDFLNLKLCGQAVTDMSIASGTMLYDIHKREWNEEFLSLVGIRKEQLPRVASMGEELGEMLPELAEKLGILPGTKIVLGGQDQKLSALGAGFCNGVATLSLGTSSAVTFSGERPSISQASGFAYDRERIVWEVAYETTGAAVRWLKNALGFSSYAQMDAEAEAAGCSSGASFDISFSKGGNLKNITLGVSRGNLVYALYESIAKEIAKSFSPDDGIREIRIFGGGSGGRLWCQLIANACKKTVAILETKETASLGAAILASKGEIPPAAITQYINIDSEVK